MFTRTGENKGGYAEPGLIGIDSSTPNKVSDSHIGFGFLGTIYNKFSGTGQLAPYADYANDTNPIFIWFEFSDKVAWNTLRVKTTREGSVGLRLYSYLIQASNDNETWNTIYTENGNNDLEKVVHFDNTTPYKFWRLYDMRTASSNYPKRVRHDELGFYRE